MMFRLLLVAAAFALANAADARAEPRAQKTQKAQNDPPVHDRPLHIYAAKGEANACGEGCSEWIAVEGRFDRDAAGRVSAFLKRHGARKLPVYFHSPGGSGTAAIAIGRQLRKLGITTGAGKTIPQGCASVSDRSNACDAAKRSAKAVAAEWRPDANCSSACVWALIGGKARHVPPSARLGVHSGKLTVMRKYSDGRVQALTAKQVATAYKGKMAEIDAEARRYIREMGIDGALMETALKVPHENIHYLSRDEIGGYGIDRREFAETPWFFAQFSNNTTYVGKWIVEAKGPERKDYRVSVVLFRCSSASQASIQYLRGLASDEVGRPAIATFAIGKHTARFALNGKGAKQDAVDTGSLFSSASSYMPFDEVETAAAHESIGVIDTDPRADTTRSPVIELSTQGLADSIKLLRGKCATSVQPVPWAAETQVPFVPADAKTQTRYRPGGGYPAELKR